MVPEAPLERTEHVLVGAGDASCLILGVGARSKGRGVRYPVNEVALAHGAGVETETADPAKPYARFAPSKPIPSPGEFPGA